MVKATACGIGGSGANGGCDGCGAIGLKGLDEKVMMFGIEDILIA
jgi:hypothetical protein